MLPGVGAGSALGHPATQQQFSRQYHLARGCVSFLWENGKQFVGVLLVGKVWFGVDCQPSHVEQQCWELPA